MKVCATCGGLFDLIEFVSPRGRTCSSCRILLRKVSLDKYYENNKVKELVRQKIYRATHADVLKESKRKSAEKCIDKKTAYMKEYRKKNKFRIRARAITARQVKKGFITMPKHCEKCGKATKLHAHHRNYMLPLLITWLCPSCHNILHGQKKVIKGLR